MSRRAVLFDCAGDRLAGTLDEGTAVTGLLIVTGGNETRAGAFSGQAQLAARIAAAGFPVFRFDRRGVGDSEGTNRGFRDSGEDIAAACVAFRAEAPDVQGIVAFGNCDAASALMLNRGADCAGLVLANPWTFEDATDDAPPASAIRARYAEKLRNPREVLRLLRGQVSIGKLMKGMRKLAFSQKAPDGLLNDIRNGIQVFDGHIDFLISSRDRTGQAFVEAWGKDPRIAICPDATHAFAEAHARDWLYERVIAALSA